MMVLVGLIILIVVGAFIDEPRITSQTFSEILMSAAAMAYAISYTRERRLFLRGINPF
jgi:hypothetical protein